MKTGNAIQECESAMNRLRQTFNQGDNRFGEYGRNVREAYARQAATFERLTGKPAPSIYND